MPKNHHGLPLEGKRIGIFGKGGAGKSTILIMLANTLRSKGYNVLVLDADSTNLGLHKALGIANLPRSLMDLFGGTVFRGGLVTCPVDDPALLNGANIKINSINNEYYRKNAKGIWFMSAGKIGEEGPGAGCDGPVAKIARDLRVIIDEEYPVTLIDFKAGLEDTARGVITSLDLIIFVVDPSLVSIEMARNIKNTVNQVQGHKLPATLHLTNQELVNRANQFYLDSHIFNIRFVINRASNQGEADFIIEQLRQREIEPSCVIFYNHQFAEAWLKGTPIDFAKPIKEATALVDLLEKDISNQKVLEGN